MSRMLEVALLSDRLTALCEEYERLREEGAANQQFLSAGGYLFNARNHLVNAANDYRNDRDIDRDTP